MITNATGGIIDDTVVGNAGDHVYMVVNGACKHVDMAHFKEHLADFKGDVTMEYREDLSLIACQGPGAMAAIQKLVPSSIDLKVPSITFIHVYRQTNPSHSLSSRALTSWWAST